MTHIEMCSYFIHCYAVMFLHGGFNRCNALWCHLSVCLTGSKSVCYRTNAVHELLSPPAHLLQWQTCITVLDFHSSMNFDGFHSFTMLFFFGVCCRRSSRFYTASVPLCCIPASYCHLSATLQTMSNTVANLQENWALFPIFIALSKFFIWIFLVFLLFILDTVHVMAEKSVLLVTWVKTLLSGIDTFYSDVTSNWCAFVSTFVNFALPLYIGGARGSTVGWGTSLRTGRSWDQFPMMSLKFFINTL
jgi:hypothetical protein